MTRPLAISDVVSIEVEDEYAEMFGRLASDDETEEERVVRNLAQVIVNRYLDASLEADSGHLPELVESMAEALGDEGGPDDELLDELANRAENYIHSEVRQQRPE